MYGWNSNPQIKTSQVVELPLAPVRPMNSVGGCLCMNWHTFGIILAVLASATLALGVADVVMTYQTYMVGQQCNVTAYQTKWAICDPNNLIWTWIGIAIWTSIPVFVFGILAIRKGSNPMLQNSWFELLAFVCTFIFIPAMVVISALEVYKGVNIYYWMYMSPLKADDLAKAIIPIVIACLGFIQFMMCCCAFLDVCCCNGPKAAVVSSQTVQVAQAAPVQQSRPAFTGSFYSANQPGATSYFSGSSANQAYNYFR